eukprot:Skav226448  [mRNA]  locus=scaffold3921:16722:25696:- [translate_table: standard]
MDLGVLGDAFSSLLQGMPAVPAALASRSGVILSLSSLVLFPLCCLRSFAQLAKFSLLGTLAVSYVVLFVVKRFLDGSYAAGGQFFTAKAATAAAGGGMFNPQMLVLVALLSTAFLVHFNAPQFYVELPPLEPKSDSERKQKLKDFSRGNMKRLSLSPAALTGKSPWVEGPGPQLEDRFRTDEELGCCAEWLPNGTLKTPARAEQPTAVAYQASSSC